MHAVASLAPHRPRRPPRQRQNGAGHFMFPRYCLVMKQHFGLSMKPTRPRATGGLRRGSGAVTSSTTNNDGNIYNVVIFLETYIGDSVLSFAL
uniref:Uncharacterized protein n=1 Tax=Oryza nivara TaxID=4536 RepID=A0A0E0I324_ORYNI